MLRRIRTHGPQRRSLQFFGGSESDQGQEAAAHHRRLLAVRAQDGIDARPAASRQLHPQEMRHRDPVHRLRLPTQDQDGSYHTKSAKVYYSSKRLKSAKVYPAVAVVKALKDLKLSEDPESQPLPKPKEASDF